MCPLSNRLGLWFQIVFSVVILPFPFYSVRILAILWGLCLPAISRELFFCSSSILFNVHSFYSVHLLLPSIFCGLLYEFNLSSRLVEFILVLDHNGSVFRTMRRINIYCSDYYSRMCNFLSINNINRSVKILCIPNIYRNHLVTERPLIAYNRLTSGQTGHLLQAFSNLQNFSYVHVNLVVVLICLDNKPFISVLLNNTLSSSVYVASVIDQWHSVWSRENRSDGRITCLLATSSYKNLTWIDWSSAETARRLIEH